MLVTCLVITVFLFGTHGQGERAKHEYPYPVRLPAVCATNKPLSLLFVGNSMSRGLDEAVKAILKAAGCRFVRSKGVYWSGHSLETHHSDMLDSKPSQLYKLLGPGRHKWVKYTHVIFQDRSQFAGFLFSEDPEERDQYERDGNALKHLVEAAGAVGAQAIVVVPWGARFGNKLRKHVYPTYEEMQEKVNIGCRTYVEKWAPNATLAPAGPAFRWVLHETGGDVHDEAFGELFKRKDWDGKDDNRHPSEKGTYLAALVIANTITGECVQHGPWKNGDKEMPPMHQLRRAACHATLEAQEALHSAAETGPMPLHHEWLRDDPT